MWYESFSLSIVNLDKKIYNSSRDIEFFLGVTFLVRPVYKDCVVHAFALFKRNCCVY